MKGITAFASMGEIDPRFVAEAEELLPPAVGAVAGRDRRRTRRARRAERREGESRLSRFLNSGWAAAAISAVVALGVLIAIVRAGQTGTPYEPLKPPVGSTIQMSDQGVNHTVSTEQTVYPAGTTRIVAILRGKTAGDSIRPSNAWYLERLTEDGAEAVTVTYTEEAWESIRPTEANGGYAQIRKSLTTAPLSEGTYRLHNTTYNGETYVSVAYCEFTVGDGEADTAADTAYPPADETVPYTVTTAATVPYGSSVIGITYRATEQGAAISMPYQNWRIVKLDGEPNGDDALYLISEEFIAEVQPTDQNGGYAQFTKSIILENPEAWLPGTYRVYTLNYSNEYVAYCDFEIVAPAEES